MLFALGLVSGCKDKEPRNNVHFFVRMDAPQCPFFYLRGKKGNILLASALYFDEYNLNPKDYTNMKDGEIREVFLNLED